MIPQQGYFTAIGPTSLWTSETFDSLVTIKVVSCIKCPVVSLAMRGRHYDVYDVHRISG